MKALKTIVATVVSANTITAVATIVLSAFMVPPRVESDAYTTLNTRGGAFLHPAFAGRLTGP